MEAWFANNFIGILEILVGGFVAYHLYFLSKKLTLRDRLDHKTRVSSQIEKLLSNIRRGLNSKIEILNVNKYHKYYPVDNSFNRLGYTYIGAELKGLQFDGVECFCAVAPLYKKPNKEYSLTPGAGYIRNRKNALKVGIIPYEWIDFVDEKGDGLSSRSQIYARFKGKGKEPYKSYKYYLEREAYDPAKEPLGMKYRLLDL